MRTHTHPLSMIDNSATSHQRHRNAAEQPSMKLSRSTSSSEDEATTTYCNDTAIGTTTSTTTDLISRLPNELLFMVWQHLDVRSLRHMYSTCRRFRDYLDADELFWRRFFEYPWATTTRRTVPHGISLWRQFLCRRDHADECLQQLTADSSKPWKTAVGRWAPMFPVRSLTR